MYNFFLTLAADVIENPEQVTVPSYEPALFKMIFTFVGLIVLIVGSVWILRRIMGGNYRHASGQKAIEVIEKKGVSPKSTVYAIRVFGKKIVFVESQAEIRKLSEVDEISVREQR